MRPLAAGRPLDLGPGAFCRLDDALVRRVATGAHSGAVVVASALTILVGAAGYGAVFGIWRSPLQAGYSALKMPLLILSVTVSSGLINAMLAQVQGAGLTFRQVFTCILFGFAITSALLGSLSPAILFLVWQIPAGEGGLAMTRYGALLFAHTSVVGLAGLLGTARLYRLLQVLCGKARLARNILLAWILVSGLVGCELSWVMSPFLARPDVPVPFLNPNAFRGNFFEYLWRAVMGELGY